MSETDASYQADVGSEQSADTMFLRAEGICNFFNFEASGIFLRNHFLSRIMKGAYINSVVLSNLNSRLTSVGAITGALSYNVPAGTWYFSLATGNSLFSMSVPNCSGLSGTILILRGFDVAGDANVLLNGGTGASLIGTANGTDLSSINLSANFYLKLMAIGDTSWAVLEQNGSATERTSA